VPDLNIGSDNARTLPPEIVKKFSSYGYLGAGWAKTLSMCQAGKWAQ
jgi:hypothetical protein